MNRRDFLELGAKGAGAAALWLVGCNRTTGPQGDGGVGTSETASQGGTPPETASDAVSLDNSPLPADLDTVGAEIVDKELGTIFTNMHLDPLYYIQYYSDLNSMVSFISAMRDANLIDVAEVKLVYINFPRNGSQQDLLNVGPDGGIYVEHIDNKGLKRYMQGAMVANDKRVPLIWSAPEDFDFGSVSQSRVEIPLEQLEISLTNNVKLRERASQVWLGMDGEPYMMEFRDGIGGGNMGLEDIPQRYNLPVTLEASFIDIPLEPGSFQFGDVPVSLRLMNGGETLIDHNLLIQSYNKALQILNECEFFDGHKFEQYANYPLLLNILTHQEGLGGAGFPYVEFKGGMGADKEEWFQQGEGIGGLGYTRVSQDINGKLEGLSVTIYLQKMLQDWENNWRDYFDGYTTAHHISQVLINEYAGVILSCEFDGNPDFQSKFRTLIESLAPSGVTQKNFNLILEALTTVVSIQFLDELDPRIYLRRNAETLLHKKLDFDPV